VRIIRNILTVSVWKDLQFLVLKMAVGALGTRFWRTLETGEKPITG
jgi:hypothetical protein